MLDKITIENFRCLREVYAGLRPLTVLVGPNDSGKSAFLAALKFLGQPTPPDPFDWWRGDRKLPLRVRVRSDGGSLLREYVGGNHRSEGDLQKLDPTRLFRLPSDGVQMLSGGYPDTGEPPEIQTDGQGIPALLDHLLRRDRKRFFTFVEAMKRLVVGLEEIEIATPDASNRRLEFVIEDGLRLPADNASTGVRMLAFFVALAYHPTPPKLILIEEPENGVHPKRLEAVVNLLREITQGKHGGHAAQVVLTTHSPHLLDCINLDTDQVLVFKRNDEDGSRTAEPADAEGLKTFMDEFMLGEVWFNEGEAGLVGHDQ